MARVLGIDWGEKRIGVALSDEMGFTATGIAVIAVSKGRELDELARIVTQERAARVVVGMPVHDDGRPSKSAPKILAFVAALEAKVAVPVERWDESNSSFEANRILKERGLGWREAKAEVDRVAAAVMLQSWLDAHGKPARIPGEDPLD